MMTNITASAVALPTIRIASTWTQHYEPVKRKLRRIAFSAPNWTKGP